MTIKNFENILINNKAKIIKKEEENKEKRRKNLQQNGYKILSEIMRLFNSIEVVAFADFGTLLGLVRENSFLKHDLDMDIGVLTDSKTKINFIIMNLERAGFRIWREFYYKKNIVEISCNYKNVKIDFNFYKVENDKIHTWLFYKLDDKKYIGNYRDCVQMTYNNFKKTDEIIIRNHMIVIPHEPEKLLIEKYGKNWKVPDKNWIYWESPAATKMNEQGYFIQYKYENDIVNK